MKVSVEERNTVVQVGATAIKVKLAAPVAQDAGVTDHGALSGLADDDHPHYSLADGSRPFTGAVSGQDPTEAEHLATRSYVDDAVSGASGTTDHGALDGLADDDHPHYSLADGTRPFTGAVSGQDPTEPAHLATRSYVDDAVSGASGTTEVADLDDVAGNPTDAPTQAEQTWSAWPPQSGTNQKLLGLLGYSEDDDQWREKAPEEGLFIPLDGSVTGSNDIAFGGGAIPGVWFDAGLASGDKMAVWATSAGHFLGWWDASAGVFKRVLGISTSNVHTLYLPGGTAAALQASSTGLTIQSNVLIAGNLSLFGSFAATNAQLAATTNMTGLLRRRRRAYGASGPLINDTTFNALTAAGLTMTLFPATAARLGAEIVVKDESGGAGGSPHTIQPDGSDTIDGAGASVSIDADHGFRRFYVGAAGAWFTC